jgi:hypothetical protein
MLRGDPVFRCFFLGVVSLPCRSSVDLSRFFRTFKALLLIPKCMISSPVQPPRIDAVYRRSRFLDFALRLILQANPLFKDP